MKKRNGSPVRFTFDDFSGLCVPGVIAKKCHDTHWQLVGGRSIVNLWPTTGKLMLDSGESSRARTLDDVEMFIGKHDIYQPKRNGNQLADGRRLDGIRYGLAVLQIEFWTLIRDGKDETAGNLKAAIEVLERAEE
jgi:hypothetical protein